MSSCYRTSNNKFASAPARMADGRHFTDYRSSCLTNTRIQADNKVVNNYEFRMFLIRNAEQLMEQNRKESFLQNGSYECKAPYDINTMVPESDKVRCNAQTCDVVHNYDKGIGRGRDYGEQVECLASMSSPPMKLQASQCKPADHLADHMPKEFDHSYKQTQNVVDMENVVPFGSDNSLMVVDEEQDES